MENLINLYNKIKLRKASVNEIKLLQRIVGTKVDGIWGKKSEARWIAYRLKSQKPYQTDNSNEMALHLPIGPVAKGNPSVYKPYEKQVKYNKALKNVVESGSSMLNGTLSNVFFNAGMQNSDKIKSAVKSAKAKVVNSDQIKENLELIKRFISNLSKNSGLTTIDTTLWLANKAGLPANATNFLRDAVTSGSLRFYALPPALIKTLADYIKGNEATLKENYNHYLSNPTLYQKLNLIKPMPNNNSNYTQSQLDIIRQMANPDGSINNASIKRVSGRYGANSSLSDYLTQDDKIVQTSIGQASGKNGNVHDVYDFNTQGTIAEKDNNQYVDAARKDKSLNYASLRAIAPYISSTDIMPNEYKIHTNIKLKS